MAPVTPRAKSTQVQPETGSSEVISTTQKPFAGVEAKVTLSSRTDKSQALDEGIRNRVTNEGKQDVKNTLTFFGKLLLPAVSMMAILFGIYALLSWFVPNRLCRDYIMGISGSTLGFGKCVYNAAGEYNTFAEWFWIVFWAVEVAWVTVFPGVVTRAIFGSAMSRVQTLTVCVCAACCLTVTFVTGLRFKMGIMNTWVTTVMNATSLISSLTCSTAAARHTGNRITRWRYFLLFFIGGQATAIYVFVMPRLLTLRSQDVLRGLGLTIVRLVIHPIIWGAVISFFRNVMRHIGRVPSLTHMCFLVWPMLYSSLYGRFLLLQLDSVGSVVLIDFMMACVGIASLLVDRGKDQGWLKLIYGERAMVAMQALPAVDDYILVEVLTSLTMEGTSIFCASALLSFGGVAVNGNPPQHKQIWTNAALQCCTLLLFNIVVVAANGKFHKVEWRKTYPKSIRKMFLFSLLVLVFGAGRLCIELLLLFCPRYYDEYGILLEQCDKPALFEAMKFSFVNRNKDNAIGRWLNLS